jgi:hypothetical protein
MLSVSNKGIMLSVVMLIVVMLSVVMLSVVMLSVVMLSVVMLSVVMLSVIMLSVVAPFHPSPIFPCKSEAIVNTLPKVTDSGKPGNTKWGSITVPLTSCLTGLD